MTRILKLCLALSVLLALPACDARTEKTDGGGVLLSVTSFDLLPVVVSVNETVDLFNGLVSIGNVEITNVPKNPGGATSELMNVEITSYEVLFTRADAGTRTPTPFVRGLFGVAPVGGTLDITGLPVADLEQLGNTPLADLLFENGGTDTETGEDSILVNCRLRFFGRTLSGDEVESAPANFTVRFTR